MIPCSIVWRCFHKHLHWLITESGYIKDEYINLLLKYCTMENVPLPILMYMFVFCRKWNIDYQTWWLTTTKYISDITTKMAAKVLPVVIFIGHIILANCLNRHQNGKTSYSITYTIDFTSIVIIKCWRSMLLSKSKEHITKSDIFKKKLE